MDLANYHKLRRAVQQNAAPESGAPLSAIAEQLLGGLLSTGLFTQVEVDLSDDPDGLVIAFCEIRREHDEQTVVAAIECVWRHGVRYPFWDVRSFLVDTSHVEFLAATRPDCRGKYFTVHLVAQKPVIPGPRGGADCHPEVGSTLIV